MKTPPFEVSFELEGWALFFAGLEARPAEPALLSELRETVVEEVRRELGLDRLSSHAPVAALRQLFKRAGCDPGRYRPSSEALLRRLLKGGEIPAIHPLVDMNNCLSAKLAVPCCVMAESSFEPPFVLRAGRSGESYMSLRGPFRLEGRPLLVDALGPCDAPITGNERVKVTGDTSKATLVAYLPGGVVEPETALGQLEGLLERAPVVELIEASAAGG